MIQLAIEIMASFKHHVKAHFNNVAPSQSISTHGLRAIFAKVHYSFSHQRQTSHLFITALQ